MSTRLPVGILFSGRGTNMQALVEAARNPEFPAEIVQIICNRPNASGISSATECGIPLEIIDHTAYDEREAFDEALSNRLKQAGVELICSAGFTRLLTEAFVTDWHNRQLNIHPSLLPSFKGLNTHQRALDQGVRITGCTVHFVRNEMDSGPIVAQAAVPVLQDDNKKTLASRVLAAEHKLYPEALRLIASGDARVTGEKVILTKPQTEKPALFSLN